MDLSVAGGVNPFGVIPGAPERRGKGIHLVE